MRQIKAKGFMLVIAVFLLLVVSVLCIALFSLVEKKIASSSRALEYERAYYAAKSALSIYTYSLNDKSQCSEKRYLFGPEQRSLANFEVVIMCQSSVTTDDKDIIKLEAIATNQSKLSSNTIKRTVSQILE